MRGGAQVRFRGTAYPEAFLDLRRGGHWAARGFQVLHMFLQPCRGDPCGRPPVSGTVRPGGRALTEGGDFTGGAPRSSRPTEGAKTSTAAGASPRPTSFPRIFQVWVGEVLGPPAGDCLSRQEVTLIRPLGGGRLGGRPHRAAPTARDEPGSLARQTQAQKRDRTKSRFCERRAPVARKKPHSSTPNFARRKLSAPFRRASLVMGDRG